MNYNLYPWQEQIMNRIQNGFKAGEMVVISSGRQTGKSYLNQVLQEFHNLHMATPYRYLDEAIVDGEKWYTVTGQKPVCAWIRTQDENLWHEHIDGNWNISYNTFDMHEKLYTMLGMKF